MTVRRAVTARRLASEIFPVSANRIRAGVELRGVNHFRSSARIVIVLGAGVALTLAACGGDDDDTADTEPPATTTAATEPTTEPATEPPTAPAEIVAEDQGSVGTSIVVAEVDLPSAGFVAVHSDDDGSPGPVIGVSDLLPAGTTDDVTVRLDEPLASDAVVHPMVHIDTNENGIYEFGTVSGVDGPGVTAEGDVAVTSATIGVARSDPADSVGDTTGNGTEPAGTTDDATEGATEGDAAGDDDTITISNVSFDGVQEVPVGTTVTVVNTDAVPHTWTAEDGTFDSGALGEGDTFEFTFTEVGEFPYFCNFHPSMTGTIVVSG